ncbi:unnamed protein product, partial [Pylaiella littoralis]
MEELFEQLQDDTQSFWQSPSAGGGGGGGIRRLDAMPSPADFFRDYVATSTPVIISSVGTASSAACFKAAAHCSTWEDVSTLVGRGRRGLDGDDDDLEVTVDFTPDGRGDCVVDVARSMMLSSSSSSSNGISSKGGSKTSDVGKQEQGSGGSSNRPGNATGFGGDSPAAAAAAGGGGKEAVPGTTAVFVKPEERRVNFETFLGMLSETATTASSVSSIGGSSSTLRSNSSDDTDGEVAYLSHQNDSLRQEFPGLMEDVEPFLALAREAFGNEPDAVNLWIGDERSLSAVHKDHYENMYCVVRGEKHFTLLPPSDVLFLHEQEYPQGRYRRARREGGGEGAGTGAGAGGFEVVMEEGTVPWVPVDPAHPDLDKYPLFRYASPVHCRVGPGDILYLPALWYHRVAQKGITVAVNYWHDMQFDHKYVYYRFLQTLAAKLQKEVVLRPAGGTGVGGGVG